MPRLLSAHEQRRICAERRRTGWGPRLLTVRTGYAHSTISKVLQRHGISRPPRAAREPVRRYEWPCPGDLLHSDWTQYARFDRPGHAVTGDRSSTAAEKRAKLGYDFAHAIVDDHSRLGYAELLPESGGDRDRLCRARTRLLRLAREKRSTADDRQSLELHAEPLAAGTAGSPGHPSPDHSQAPPAGEREG